MSVGERDADGAHRVIGEEVLDIGIGRQRRGGDREIGGLGIESLAAELTVEILGIFGGAVEMHERRATVAESKRRAAEPVFGKSDLLRALGGGAQRQEMPQRRLRLVEEAQRDPAGEELRLDIIVARDRPVLGRDHVGDARLPGIERDTAIEAPFAPPPVGIDQLGLLARRIEQHLPGFLVAVFASKPLDAVVQKPDIAVGRAGRQRGEQLARIRAAFDHGDARRDLLLLGGGEELCNPERRVGGDVAVGKQQLVDARLVILHGQHRAEPGQDLFLHRRVQLIVAPGRDHQLACRRLIAVLEVGARERRLAGAGKRGGAAEKGPDLVGARIGEKECDLGPFAELVLTWPIWIGDAERFDLISGRVEIAVPIFVPGGKLARRGVADPRDCGV